MKNLNFLLLSLVMLVFAGCSAGVQVEDNLSGVDGVQVEDNTLTVESENGDASATLNEDGSVTAQTGDTSATAKFEDDGSIVVESNVDVSGAENVALADWCIEGTTLDQQVDESVSVAFEILGIEIFKGEDHCVASGLVQAGDYEVPTVLYIKDLNSEFWIVSEVFGKTIERKIQPEFNQN